MRIPTIATRTASLRWNDLVPWALPVGVAYIVYRWPTHRLTLVTAGIAAVLTVAAVVRHPGKSLAVLIVLSPLQVFVLATVFQVSGVGLKSLNSVIVVGIVAAGGWIVLHGRSRLDVADRIVLAYIAVVTVYFAFPDLFFFGARAGAGGPPHDLTVRLQAYRADAGFALLFLGARHARIEPRFRRTVFRATVGIAVVAAAAALFEFAASAAWNDFVTRVIAVPRYQALVLGAPVPNPADIRIHFAVAGKDVIRAGSVLMSPLNLSFYLLIPIGLLLERLVSKRVSHSFVNLLVVAGGLVATVTRSSVAAALLMAAIALRPDRSSPRPGRLRLAILGAAGVMIALPLASSTGLTTRATHPTTADPSAEAHRTQVEQAIDLLTRQPLGRGLGTAPGVGERFAVQGQVTSENAYLQVGNELGIPAMVLFIAALVAVLRSLARARDEPAFPLARGLWLAGIGLVVTGLFLHVWLDVNVSWTFWGAAGLALNPAAAPAPDLPEPAEAIAT